MIQITSYFNAFFLLNFQVRDYIHVVDLADGHIAALNKLSDPSFGMRAYPLVLSVRHIFVKKSPLVVCFVETITYGYSLSH